MSLRTWFKSKRRSKEAEPPATDEAITVFDERGRALKVERSTWRDSVLLPNIEKAWNDADALYRYLADGLRDGFAADVLPAAERLRAIEDGSERSRLVLAITRLQVGDLAGAERELQACIAEHGRTGLALTNLAKLYAAQGDHERSAATLREALETAPNHDDGALLWWATLARERGGEAAYLSALEEIAGVQGAWRPQLWLARACLGRADVARALALYQHVLAQARDEPGVLMMVSGDLGNAGALEQLVSLVAPHYEPDRHGPETGLNLAEALKQLRRPAEAKEVVRRVQTLGLAPFAARLSQLETEIAAGARPEMRPEEPEIMVLPFDSPAWTRGLYSPDWLLPERGEDLPSLTFVALANESRRVKTSQSRPVDAAGRTTRAVPLYLAEAFLMRYAVRTRCILLAAQGQGPVVFSSTSDLSSLRRLAPDQGSPRIVVGGSLTTTGISLTAWDVAAGTELAAVEMSRVGADDGTLAATLLDELAAAFKPAGFLRKASAPDYYRSPTGELRAGYALALEQLTHQLLASSAIVPAGSLWNERGFFETYFELAERWPAMPVNAQLIAICGVVAAAGYGSTTLAPYRKVTLEWLERAPPGSVLDRIAPAVYRRLGEEERFRESLVRAPRIADARYHAWLERVKEG